MEKYIEEYCKLSSLSFDKIIQQYNLNRVGGYSTINKIIRYKIENNKNIIYKEDILKLFSKRGNKDESQEEFMENVIKEINYHNLDINNLTIEKGFYSDHIQLYYLSTFLDHEPVDIKIALKD